MQIAYFKVHTSFLPMVGASPLTYILELSYSMELSFNHLYMAAILYVVLSFLNEFQYLGLHWIFFLL
jgi:hypothetical protein